MRYYIVAGEASGDLHGSNLMKSILKKDPKATFRFFGGDKMKAVGGELVKHYKDTAFMGFVPVLLNLRTILRNIKNCQKDIIAFKADVVILIDYPGFNLKIAKFIKEKGIPVHYYISPKIWAWKESRIHKIKAYVDNMITILPFETAFYKKHNMEVTYVGNPLFDQIEAFKATAKPILANKPILAILPGSRKMELERMLPVMAKAAKNMSNDYAVYVACTPDFSVDFYKSLVGNLNASFVVDQTYNLLNSAKLAMVTSGTATLETAIFKVPQVICYRGPALVVAAAKKFIKVPFIGLANLTVGKEIVKELIQQDLTPVKIEQELRVFETEAGAKVINDNYDYLLTLLGGAGASDKAADAIIAELK